jgi:hypothetical protein
MANARHQDYVVDSVGCAFAVGVGMVLADSAANLSRATQFRTHG